jgi:hypothetical protein
MSQELPTSTRYEDFNVMEQQQHWDDHTRRIVQNRLEPLKHFYVFTPEEERIDSYGAFSP